MLLLLYLFLLIECGNWDSVLVCDLGFNFGEYRLLVCDSIFSFKLRLNTHMIFGGFCYVYTSIFKSKDLMLENIRLCHMVHSLKFSLFRILNQQSLHLYQSIGLLN